MVKSEISAVPSWPIKISKSTIQAKKEWTAHSYASETHIHSPGFHTKWRSGQTSRIQRHHWSVTSGSATRSFPKELPIRTKAQGRTSFSGIHIMQEVKPNLIAQNLREVKPAIKSKDLYLLIMRELYISRLWSMAFREPWGPSLHNLSPLVFDYMYAINIDIPCLWTLCNSFKWGQ